MDAIDPHPRRAALVCPGSDIAKVSKALGSVADEVVVDLEDAVAPDRKSEARRSLSLLRSRTGAGVTAVRVNGPQTPWFVEDVEAVTALEGTVTSVVVPKVEHPDDLAEVERILDSAGAGNLGVQALIETARGMRDIDAVAASGGRLTAMILGYADLGAQLGRSPSAPPELWLAVQDRFLIAARAAGVQAIDGPALYTAADERLSADAARAAALGFDGKWVIHPAQVTTVCDAFTPSEPEVNRARAVLDALAGADVEGRGAVSLDGMMLDEAVAVAARRTLTRAGVESS